MATWVRYWTKRGHGWSKRWKIGRNGIIHSAKKLQFCFHTEPRDHINLQKHNPEIILMFLVLRANFPFIIIVRFWSFHVCFKNAEDLRWDLSKFFDKNSVLETRLLYSRLIVFCNQCNQIQVYLWFHLKNRKEIHSRFKLSWRQT